MATVQQVSIQYSAEPFYCYDVCVLIYNVIFIIKVTAAWNTASAGLLVTNRKEERWKRGRKWGGGGSDEMHQ